MDEQLTSAEVSKRRITTQLKGAVKALQAAHVRDHSSVVYRFDFYDLIHSGVPEFGVIWVGGREAQNSA